MKSAPNPHAKRLVLLVWVMVLFFYIYVSYDFVRVERINTKFGEALQHIAQIAGSERRAYKDIRTLVLVRADEFGLPVTVDQISITGSGPTLKMVVGYDIEIDIPIFARGFYTKHYEHKVGYRQGY
jgi:hypothetical protein